MTRLAVCVVLVAMLASISVAVAQEGLEEECWYDRMCVSGYFHFRYVDTDESGVNDGFDFTRMFLTIQGDLDERNHGVITLSRVGPDDPNIDLYNAFVDYKINDVYSVQVGQVPTWFGLEAWEGSSVRLPFERAKILQAGPGFYYQGASDRGVWFRRNPIEGAPLIVLGLCNGQFRSDDANDDKVFSIDLKWDRPWGQFGASYMDGTLVSNDAETDRNALDAYVRVLPHPWGVQAEWADGELLGADRDGYYIQGVYELPTGNDTVFARWEEFNADMDASNTAEYEALTLGWAHEMFESSELTVQYTNSEWTRTGTVDGASGNSDDNMIGVQWQYAFR